MQQDSDDMSHVSADARSAQHWSIDDLLGSAIKIKQPVNGFRISIDTLLLAACVPAQSGDTVLDAGAGVAGAALSLAHRVKGLQVTGFELQREMVDYARENIAINDMQGSVSVIEGDITQPPAELKPGSFDHVIANPPYLPQGKAIRSPSKNKDLANMDKTANLKSWVNFCVNMSRHKGSISFIYRADRLDELISRLYGKVGDLQVCPLWPHEGEAAKRVLVQGRKGVSGGMRILPGLVLHGADGAYTKEVDSILRQGAALDMGTIKPMKSMQGM